MRNQHSAAEKIKEISGTNPLKCMKCGKCSATCPSFNEMDIKPHQFVSYVVNEDIEDTASAIDNIVESEKSKVKHNLNTVNRILKGE